MKLISISKGGSRIFVPGYNDFSKAFYVITGPMAADTLGVPGPLF